MLKLKEAQLFHEVTGRNAHTVLTAMAPQPCRKHRLIIGGCEGCREAQARPGTARTVACVEHNDEFQACPNCIGGFGNATEDDMFALAWVLKRRTEPELEWETFAEAAEILEVMELVGNALAGARTPR